MELKRKLGLSVWPTLLMGLLLVGCFIIGAFKVNEIATDSCFETLNDAAAEFVIDIRRNIENEKKKLQVIAEITAEYEDISSEQAKARLSLIEQRGLTSSLAVLLPENKAIFFRDGGYKEVESILDFQTEKEKGAYVSGVLESALESGEKFIYQAVPVQKDGEVKGILYEFINLKSLPKRFVTKTYGGTSQLYILDSTTGDFIMDTRHDELGNLYDGSMGDWQVKNGYRLNQWEEDIRAGRESQTIFYSINSDEIFYICAKPIGINEWTAQVAAPEKAVFARAERIRQILYILAVTDVLLLVVYFADVVGKVREYTQGREQRLQQTMYMYDVQKTLFDAHKYPDRMVMALQKAAAMLGASFTFFCSGDGKGIEQFYKWSENQDWEIRLTRQVIWEILDIVGAEIVAGKNVLLDERDKKADAEKAEREQLKKYGIHSLMLVPVQDSDGKTIGVLGAVNTKRFHKDAKLLECIAWNFMMATHNRRSYQTIRRMGIIDAITDLKNRNSYEVRLRELDGFRTKHICCIYMDVNGLHELNNTKGHAVGDAMLRYIGDTLRGQFGSEDTYRIGGDEFAVFGIDASEEAIQKMLLQVEEKLVEKEYYISIGVAWKKAADDMEKVVGLAEQRMYEQKRLFYEKNGLRGRAR